MEDGWLILQTASHDEGYYINDRIAVGESGSLLEYSSVETNPNGKLQLGPKSKGIVRPNLIAPDEAIELLSSDLVVKAIATLINTGKVHTIEGNFHLSIHSTSLNDSWDTKL